MMNSPIYACAEIRQVWEKEARQLWDSRTHGRGLSLLILKMGMLPGSVASTNKRALTVEFWRDQNKVRGRFIGAHPGSGVVVARLGEDGIPLAD